MRFALRKCVILLREYWHKAELCLYSRRFRFTRCILSLGDLTLTRWWYNELTMVLHIEGSNHVPCQFYILLWMISQNFLVSITTVFLSLNTLWLTSDIFCLEFSSRWRFLAMITSIGINVFSRFFLQYSHLFVRPHIASSFFKLPIDTNRAHDWLCPTEAKKRLSSAAFNRRWNLNVFIGFYL